MSSLVIGLISAGCIFGGALLGMWLHKVLPERHLDDASKDTVKLGAGLLATLAALLHSKRRSQESQPSLRIIERQLQDTILRIKVVICLDAVGGGCATSHPRQVVKASPQGAPPDPLSAG